MYILNYSHTIAPRFLYASLHTFTMQDHRFQDEDWGQWHRAGLGT